MKRMLTGLCFLTVMGCVVEALERPGTEFRIYQFPSGRMPRIDGQLEDWSMVPESYVVGTSELWEDSGKHEGILPESLNVRIRVGWVKGFNRLYFSYEAFDDYWDFSLPGLKNDTFEVVVDGNLSGEPLIDRFRSNPEVLSESESYFSMHGVHAQNYHIFTPHVDKDWTMFWGPSQWVKALPYANAAQSFSFKAGEAGHYVLEFYITLFDHASPRGAAYSAETELRENTLVGLAWAIIDYDDVASTRNNGFWNLSRSHTMYGKADELVAFRLMPLEAVHIPELEARWTCSIIDLTDRLVAFHDHSVGTVTEWEWDFGEGRISTEQHPVHRYESGGKYVVTLTVKGPAGTSRFTRVWDVTLP